MFRKTIATVVIIAFAALVPAGCSVFGKTGDSADKKGAQPAAVQSAATQAAGDKAGAVPTGEAARGQSAASGNSAGESDVKRDSGRYVGQIDNNFIEIKISGVPESVSARSFMLGEKVKDEFSGYGLKKDDEVLVTYRVNSNQQNVISEIKKIGSQR